MTIRRPAPASAGAAALCALAAGVLAAGVLAAGVLGAGLLVVGLVGGPALATAAPAEPFDAGDLRVVSANDIDDPISGGGSATVFSVVTPDGASCPGDSEHDQWRTQSFIIPAADDPRDLVFTASDPEGEGRWSLYGVDTRAYVDEFLPRNESPGQPARIPPARPLSFGVFPPGYLPAGRYLIGIACTAMPRQLAMYWDAEIEIVDDPQDQPGRIRWTVVSPSLVREPDGDAGPNWSLVALVSGAVGLAAFGALSIRQRTRVTPASEEQS